MNSDPSASSISQSNDPGSRRDGGGWLQRLFNHARDPVIKTHLAGQNTQLLAEHERGDNYLDARVGPKTPATLALRASITLMKGLETPLEQFLQAFFHNRRHDHG